MVHGTNALRNTPCFTHLECWLLGPRFYLLPRGQPGLRDCLVSLEMSQKTSSVISQQGKGCFLFKTPQDALVRKGKVLGSLAILW